MENEDITYPIDGYHQFSILSDVLLTQIADHLDKPSRAMFASALTAPSSSWRKHNWNGNLSTVSTVIISCTQLPVYEEVFPLPEGVCKLYADRLESAKMWHHHLEKRCRKSGMKTPHESLDEIMKRRYYREKKGVSKHSTLLWESLYFADIDKTLAERLTDDDLGAILATISAVANIRRLDLSGIITIGNITGNGLKPLRGSTTLEYINLGIWRDEHSLSKQDILPILDSIIVKDDSSLNCIKLPLSWTEPPDEDSIRRYRQIQERFNQVIKKPNIRYVSLHSDRFLRKTNNPPTGIVLR